VRSARRGFPVGSRRASSVSESMKKSDRSWIAEWAEIVNEVWAFEGLDLRVSAEDFEVSA
jgi:hypothetical protein